MIRGITAQFKFKLPYALKDIDNLVVKFWQSNNPSESLPIFKYKSSCEERVEKEIYVSLRPSETALFSDKYKAKLQLRAQPIIGVPFGTEEQLIPVYPMPEDIIIDDPTIDPDIPKEDEWFVFDGGTIVNWTGGEK